MKGNKNLRYAVQKTSKSGYMPPVGNKPHSKPEIKYYEANSIYDANRMHLFNKDVNWKYSKVSPIFEIGDYIGDCNDTCYLIKEISDEMITIYNPISNKEYTDFVDYERWHLLRKHNHKDVTDYPIGSKWHINKTSGLYDNGDIIIITDYALSYGYFWASCENKLYCRFIVTCNDIYKTE